MKSLLKALHDMINYLFSSLLFGLLKKNCHASLRASFTVHFITQLLLN